jgi:hypothetical protein
MANQGEIQQQIRNLSGTIQEATSHELAIYNATLAAESELHVLSNILRVVAGKLNPIISNLIEGVNVSTPAHEKAEQVQQALQPLLLQDDPGCDQLRNIAHNFAQRTRTVEGMAHTILLHSEVEFSGLSTQLGTIADALSGIVSDAAPLSDDAEKAASTGEIYANQLGTFTITGQQGG